MEPKFLMPRSYGYTGYAGAILPDFSKSKKDVPAKDKPPKVEPFQPVPAKMNSGE